ncbi:MAG TPA: hypothetical protein VHO47_02350 [Candidatus Babeliales bacterium]|nr:hypothetical protein [Candidatus Babeliales bacterium]
MNIGVLSRSLLLWLSVIVSALQADQLVQSFKRIDNAKINYFKAKVEWEIKRGKLIKKAMVGAAVIGAGVVAYQWLSEPVIPPLPCPNIKGELNCDEVIKNFLPKIDLIIVKQEAMSKTISTIAPNGDYSLGGWFQWGKTLFWGALMNQLAIASLSPFGRYFKMFDESVDKVVARLFHESRLTWYLAHRVSLPVVFAEIESMAERIDNNQPVLTELKTDWALLVIQIESILGFMEHRMSSMGSYLHERGLQISQSVKDAVDETASSLEQLVISSQPMYKQTLGAMRTKIDQQLHAFADIETIDSN